MPTANKPKFCLPRDKLPYFKLLMSMKLSTHGGQQGNTVNNDVANMDFCSKNNSETATFTQSKTERKFHLLWLQV
jgi:hypothetical protein